MNNLFMMIRGLFWSFVFLSVTKELNGHEYVITSVWGVMARFLLLGITLAGFVR